MTLTYPLQFHLPERIDLILFVTSEKKIDDYRLFLASFWIMISFFLFYSFGRYMKLILKLRKNYSIICIHRGEALLRNTCQNDKKQLYNVQ